MRFEKMIKSHTGYIAFFRKGKDIFGVYYSENGQVIRPMTHDKHWWSKEEGNQTWKYCKKAKGVRAPFAFKAKPIADALKSFLQWENSYLQFNDSPKEKMRTSEYELFNFEEPVCIDTYNFIGVKIQCMKQEAVIKEPHFEYMSWFTGRWLEIVPQ